MDSNKNILIIGGSRSGKSEFAEALAAQGKKQVYYLATGVVTDGEMQKRVSQHQARRSAHWHTIEEALNPQLAVARLPTQQGILLLDSLAGWLTNLMYHNNWEHWQWDENKEAEVLKKVEILFQTLARTNLDCLLVADEVGMGLVPSTPEGRAFRDLNGRANQLAAAWSDEVYFVVAGLPTKIK